LEFATDPFFYDLPQRLARHHGASFINIGQGALNKQCLAALTPIAAVLADTHPDLEDELHEQFMLVCSIRIHGSIIYKQRNFKPSLIWAAVAVDGNFDVMAKFLVKVHNNPSSAVGGERNHKTNNRV
jgi:hypothetical protein